MADRRQPRRTLAGAHQPAQRLSRRAWEPAPGPSPLKIPKLRKGSYFRLPGAPPDGREGADGGSRRPTSRASRPARSMSWYGHAGTPPGVAALRRDRRQDPYRPLEGDWPWLDATYVMRQAGRIVSVAVITAGVNDHRRLGGRDLPEFLRALTRRGSRRQAGDHAHEGLTAAARVLNATWQRCRVHFMRNLLAHAGKSGRRVVAAFVATAFAQEDAQTAKTQWRQVADQLRPKAPKLANLMDQAEPDRAGLHDLPKGTPHQAALDQSDRAPQRRDQATHQRRRHLSKRGRHNAANRCHPARAERRLGGPESPIHDPGKHHPKRS